MLTPKEVLTKEAQRLETMCVANKQAIRQHQAAIATHEESLKVSEAELRAYLSAIADIEKKP